MSAAPQSMLVGGAAASAGRLSAMDLQRIKSVLEACGVAEVRGSPHIYAHPESIHLISQRDLVFLLAHADILATHKDLQYDVRAFTGILWGMTQTAERHIEKVLRVHAAADAASGSTGDIANGPVTTPKAASAAPSLPSAAVEAPARTSVTTNVANLYTAIYPHLIQVFRVTSLLRAFESHDALPDVRAARRIAQVDIDVVARLAGLLVHLFLSEAGERSSTPLRETGALNVTAAYTNVCHHLFRTTETALSAAMLLLASLAARPGSDAGPVLRFFHGVDAWRAGALGLRVTDSYCTSVRELIFALFHRRRDFDNVEDVASQLLLQRIASRPPYQWRTVRLLYFSVQDIGARDVHTAEDRQGSSAFGQLLVFRRIQRAVQACLTTDCRDSAEDAATVRALRRALAARVQRAWLEPSAAATTTTAPAPSAVPRLLSYYELLVLAALEGMPAADLTKEAELLRRAEQTKLSAEPEVLTPSFLRLLLACCYTVPSSNQSNVPHALLSTASTLALYESLSKHVLQVPLCATAVSAPEVNRLFDGAALRIETLVDLCVWNAIENTREDERELAEGLLPGTGEEAVAAAASARAPADGSATATAAAAMGGAATAKAGTNATAPLPLPPIPSATSDALATAAVVPALALPKPPTPTTALFRLIRRDTSLLFNGNEDVLLHTPEAAQSRARNFPEGFSAMTLATTRHLFRALTTADIFHHIAPTDLLPVVAQLYALRAYYPLSVCATEAELPAVRRLLGLMQNTLALLPQEMTAPTVNQLLCRSLVPMSTTASQSNRLQLAHFEAYLRAMATASAANAVADEVMLQHWVDVAVPAITNRHSAALSNAGHDFLIAAFRAEKYVSPLFVPTYVALYIPAVELSTSTGSVATTSPYPPLSVTVIQHFARMVRAACRGIERCDSTALARLIEEDGVADGEAALPSSMNAAAAYMAKLSPAQRAALRRLTPTNAVLLVVSALFDRLCLLWNSTPGYVKVAQDLFMAYFSGLCNLLQCTSTPVLQRVCASIEAIEVEHLRGSGAVQFQFLKYVSAVVDTVQGPSKVGIAEWFLKMNKRIQEQNYGKHSKL